MQDLLNACVFCNEPPDFTEGEHASLIWEICIVRIVEGLIYTLGHMFTAKISCYAVTDVWGVDSNRGLVRVANAFQHLVVKSGYWIIK